MSRSFLAAGAITAALVIPPAALAQRDGAPNSQPTLTVSQCSAQIAVKSWSVGIDNSSSAGRASLGPLTVTKSFDACSPFLAESAARGRHIQKATLVEYTTSGVPALTIELQDVMVEKYLLDDPSAAVGTAETLALSYGKITIENSASNTKFCWDVGKNALC